MIHRKTLDLHISAGLQYNKRLIKRKGDLKSAYMARFNSHIFKTNEKAAPRHYAVVTCLDNAALSGHIDGHNRAKGKTKNSNSVRDHLRMVLDNIKCCLSESREQEYKNYCLQSLETKISSFKEVRLTQMEGNSFRQRAVAAATLFPV